MAVGMYRQINSSKKNKWERDYESRSISDAFFWPKTAASANRKTALG